MPEDLAHRVAEEEHKAIVRRVYEAFSTGNLDALDQLLDPNVVDHNPVPGQIPGVEGVKQVITTFRSAFPDLHVTIEDLVAEGYTVAARVTYRGTHQGEFMGTPPTGKQITVSAMDIMRIADGKITDRWGNADNLGMLQQLGAIPAPGEAAS